MSRCEHTVKPSQQPYTFLFFTSRVGNKFPTELMLKRGDPFLKVSPRPRLGKLIVWAGVNISLVRKIESTTFAVP
jgi:hypothetical protein